MGAALQAAYKLMVGVLVVSNRYKVMREVHFSAFVVLETRQG